MLFPPIRGLTVPHGILGDMKHSSQLTEEEKQNGKREFLTPLPQTLAESTIYPVSIDNFTGIVTAAIVPSPLPHPKAQ